MKKVKVLNNVNGMKFTATMLDPTRWVSEQIAKDTWGKAESWTLFMKEYDLPVYENIIDENGIPQTVLIRTDHIVENICDLPQGATTKIEVADGYTYHYFYTAAEYTITIIDQNDDIDYQALKALINEYQADIDALQSAKDNWATQTNNQRFDALKLVIKQLIGILKDTVKNLKDDKSAAK